MLSGFTLGLVASLLFLSLLFLNSSFSEWHFPFSNLSPSSNVSITPLYTIHQQQLSKIPQVNVSNQGFENTVLGNFSENGYNVSFQSNGVDKVGNFSVGRGEIDGNLSGSVEENLKDGKFDEKCDIFDGNWVRDDSKPYYELGSCPFVDRDFDCHLNGRPDSDYVKWKWKPNGCDIPRYVLCMHD